MDNYVTLARLCYMKNFTSSTDFCPTEYRRICGLQIASAESDLLLYSTLRLLFTGDLLCLLSMD